MPEPRVVTCANCGKRVARPYGSGWTGTPTGFYCPDCIALVEAAWLEEPPDEDKH